MTEPAVPGGIEIVDVGDEADRATSQALRRRLEEIAGRPEGGAIVDLSAASFIDSSTLGVLAVSSQLFRSRGRPFAIVCPPGDVRMMFELTALERILALYDARAEAVTALGGSV